LLAVLDILRGNRGFVFLVGARLCTKCVRTRRDVGGAAAGAARSRALDGLAQLSHQRGALRGADRLRLLGRQRERRRRGPQVLVLGLDFLG
jgi:hypothetical protein